MKTDNIQATSVFLFRRSHESASLGSGVLVTRGDRTLVITNAHCVGTFKSLTVETFEDEHYDAKLIGMCPASDVAVLELKDAPANMPTAIIGDSDKVDVRDQVFAVGSPLDAGLKFTITGGIISQRDQFSLPSLPCFQTDAAISPGNSGGGLFNNSGELIGINSAAVIVGGGQVNLGFSIKINDFMRVVDQILTHGGSVMPTDISLMARAVDPVLAEAYGRRNTRGIVVNTVDERSALGGKLLFGDLILQIGDIRMKQAEAFNYALQRYAGEAVIFRLLRAGKEELVSITIPSRVVRVGKSVVYDNFGLVLLDNPQMGLMVQSVEAGSPAEKAHVERGDFIRAVMNLHDGAMCPVDSVDSFYAAAETFGEGAFGIVVEHMSDMPFIKALKRKEAK
ncbi:MAG: trypsin-like serine protease [Proteobacteria bacterium]|nr:trypsin-like serine protease [Pseudomonadota bacterium]